MLGYALKRFFQMLLVVVAVSMIVFLVMSFTGDPVLLFAPPNATDAQLAEIRASLGLDRSHFVQYGAFAANVLRGDFGVSYVFKQPVLKLIVARMPATLELVFFSMLISLLIAIPAAWAILPQLGSRP